MGSAVENLFGGFAMMTLERAAELVEKFRTTDPDGANELFMHFDDVFHLSADRSGDKITSFAEMCGYPIAIFVQRV